MTWKDWLTFIIWQAPLAAISFTGKEPTTRSIVVITIVGAMAVIVRAIRETRQDAPDTQDPPQSEGVRE